VLLDEAQARRPAAPLLRRRKRVQAPVAAALLALAVLLLWLALRSRRQN
jgi:type VI protein secretion system component VasK